MDIKDIVGVGEIGKELVKQAGESVKPLVTSLAEPSTKTIGQRLSDIVDLVFTPVELAKIYKDNKIDSFRHSLTNKINAIPKEKRMEPPLNVIGPAIEAAKYHIDDELLREMFAELVACSMHSDVSNFVHPSFVEIIKQLSAADAKFLNAMCARGPDKRKSFRNAVYQGIVYVEAELRAYEKTKNTNYIIMSRSLRDFNYEVGVESYEDMLSSINISYENLKRLNLLETEQVPMQNFTKSDYIECFATTCEAKFKEWGNDMFNFEVVYVWHLTKHTMFGKAFCDIVLPSSRFCT